ncbi:MAG: ABC transporter substrate-binding protein [Gammaproteobacteria bacterium]|nr:ABC transporter substrate-binding protein [Gammaproteobacteria bacterium]
MLLLIFWVPVATAAQNPYSMIERVSNELLIVVRNSGKTMKSNPERYYSDVDRVLEPVVAFDYIARRVMGSAYWKKATAAQQDRFIQVFRRNLVASFARGVANFGDLEVKVISPGTLPKGRKVQVLQEVRGEKGLTRVSYTLGRFEAGQWKLINVLFNGISLARAFHGQFAQSMKDNRGDIDKVIANWSANEAEDKTS